MKSGLHTFIQSEVDCLHQTLVQKIYGGQTVPLPPCTTCNASLVKRNKFTGVWEFQKQCSSYCYDWLHELLKLHASPKSEKIYWDNSDVPNWPFKPWECAKVFMPRGQQPSNTGPAECDAQALLTVLANCKHFHPKLSQQGQGLMHKISVMRNKVMHDGEMRVSDTDLRNYLQLVIQLLEDHICLKSIEDCKAAVYNIHKIHNDSVDVFLNVDQEMIALKTVVNEVRQELGMQEKRTLDTVVLLKEEYSQLREKLTIKLADVEARVDGIERNVQSVKEQTDTALQKQEKKHQEMLGSITSQLTKRYDDAEARVDSIEQDVQSVKEETDTALQKQEKSIQNISASVATCQIRLNTVEENMQSLGTKLQEFETVKEQANSALQEQNKFSESMETMSANVAEHGVRLQEMEQRIEQNNSCAKESSTKRRPESDGLRQLKKTSTKRRPESDDLRQLKSQIEDRLDTVRRLGFIPTKQTEEAKKLLQDKRSIVIQGNPGEGKTTTALLLIDDERWRDKRVLVMCPKDWTTIDTDWVDIVILEDIFGQFDLDPSRLQEWLLYLPTIQEHVDAGKLQVIITTRVDILAKAYPNLGSIDLFCDEFALTLSSEKLLESEKMKILDKELQRRKRELQDDDKKECIANFKGLIGFPQCCSFFAGDKGLFVNGPDFFKQPEKLFSVNMSRLEDSRFLSLAFLFCTGGISEKDLSPEALPEFEKSILIELAFHLNISKEKASVTLLRESYDNFSGLYVKKYQSSISFSHNTVWEAVGCVLGERSPEMVVKYSDAEYLNQRTYAAETKDKTSHNVFIPVSAYGQLAERIILDGVHGRLMYSRLDKHSAFKQHQFVTELKDDLRNCDRIYDFLFFNQWYRDEQNLAEGECRTFLQLLLQSDGNTAKVVYYQFLEFLICSHDRFDTECRKCSEKKCLLELALYYNQLDIADKLIAMNACISPISLCNAVKHGNLNRVKTILGSLKRDGPLDPQNKYARKSLCRAFISGNPSLVELLLKDGIVLDSSHVMCVVRQGDIDALVKLVEYLKRGNDWDPLHEKGNQANLWEKSWISDSCLSCQNELQFSKALYFAYRVEKLDMAEFLLKEGVKVTMDIFLAVLGDGSYAAATKVLQDLKDTDRWNPDSVCVLKAAEIAYRNHNCDLFELLIQKKVTFSVKNLPCVVSWGSSDSVTKVLQHLKLGLNWDPKSNYASHAFKNAIFRERNDICVLLVNEGVPFTMDIVTDINHSGRIESFTMVIEHLRKINKWDPKSDIASEILKISHIRERNDMSEQLLQEGVTLTMANLPNILQAGSRDSVIKAIHHLKHTRKWDVRLFCLSQFLIPYLPGTNYDICDILIQQGVLLEMDDLHHLINCRLSDFVPKAIQHLKDNGNWDPNSFCATVALTEAYKTHNYDICDLLVHEGVSLSMRNLSHIIQGSGNSLEPAKRAIQHLKKSNNWDQNFECISTELAKAYRYRNYNLCDMLIQEGVFLSMKDLPCVIGASNDVGSLTSVESVTKAILHLKNTNSWDSKSCHAFMALESACVNHMYDVSNQLFQEGVSFTMKNILDAVLGASRKAAQHLKQTEFITQTLKHLEDSDAWDPPSTFVTQELKTTIYIQKNALVKTLLQAKISQNMNIKPEAIYSQSNEFIEKLTKLMKETNSWDPTSHFASDALELAFRKQNYDVCNLLIHEKVLLTMKNLPGVVFCGSIKAISKTINHLKDKGNWDPHCECASVALQEAYVYAMHDVCDLLIQEGILPTMENLLHLVKDSWPSLKSVMKVVQHLKDTNNWFAQSEYASEALVLALCKSNFKICEFLILEGVSLTMSTRLYTNES